ncbi:MAG: helix-turn-helix domain-containing protein [Niabella sp.]
METYFSREGNFIDFFPFTDYEDEMLSILKTEDTETARDRLENYWMQKFVPRNFELVNKILNDIGFKKIEEIAIENNISRQALHRIFKKHFGKSPIQYRRIQRFRNSLLQSEKKLVQKGLSVDFYDQSHFIKEVEKFTNNSPKKFFKEMVFETSNPWLII